MGARTDSWYSRHASALFITGLVLVGLALGLYGLYLSQRSLGGVSYFGNVFAHFSGALIAAAVGTAFLSLPDVRQYVAATVARLFSEAEVVELLSEENKARLRERLALDAVRNSVSSFDSSLFNHLQTNMNVSLSGPYITNLSFSTTISPSSSDLQLVIAHRVVTYRMNARNVSSPQYIVPFIFFTDSSLPSDLTLPKSDWLQSFHARAGEVEFEMTDVQVTQRESGNLTIFEAELSKKIPIRGEVDVTVEYRILTTLSDPTVSCFARYPSYGVTASLYFREDYAYDSSWFMSCPPSNNIPGRAQVSYLPNGITVRTNDWVLPGEGMVLYFFPKPGMSRLQQAEHIRPNQSAAGDSGPGIPPPQG